MFTLQRSFACVIVRYSTAHNSNDRLHLKSPSSPAQDYSVARVRSFSVLEAAACEIFFSGLLWWIKMSEQFYV